jgi:hypothetical protein
MMHEYTIIYDCFCYILASCNIHSPQDVKLFRAVQKYTRTDGLVNWSDVAKCFKGERNASQCRQHWRHTIKDRAGAIHAATMGAQVGEDLLHRPLQPDWTAEEVLLTDNTNFMFHA